MPENPYTRSVDFNVTELVPVAGNLPYCHGAMKDGSRCPHRARWNLNGKAVCGQHMGPRTLFFPENLIKD